MPLPESLAWRRMRARMQLVPQDPLGALDRRLTIAEQVGGAVGDPWVAGGAWAGWRRCWSRWGLRADQGARHPHAFERGAAAAGGSWRGLWRRTRLCWFWMSR